MPVPDPRAADPEAAALEPVGARLGSFIIYPKAEAALMYDDNIYALEDKTDDAVIRLSPSIGIQGDMGRYTTNLRGRLDRFEYSKRDSESRTDWSVNGGNRYELAERTYLTGNAGYSRSHEDRGDPNSSFTNLRPNVYKLTELGAGLSRDLARLRAGIVGGYKYYNYNDAEQIGGGITNNDDRDRHEYLVEGRLGYEFSPGYALIGRFQWDQVDYRLPFDDATFDRDSRGWRATAGVGFELTRLLIGEVSAGYLHRSYDDSRFGGISRASFGAALNWYPTEITAVRLTADRKVEETVTPNYRGFLASSFTLNVEHELLRTLTLTASARYSHNDYVRANTGLAPRRNDDVYGASLLAKYALNRNLYTSLGYDWVKRDSTAIVRGSNFSRNKVWVAVGTQF
ncbi:outer membrane beta-barrel protein [Sphingomonas oleivorans]|uniref:outer membrane beta-barrel protein n=1 Tax=Sphingomonas oleivorans TaxID=1735121 RepID=UPI0013FDB6D6|nr:outer membrane beta-barrel protein [Sphingomonas oleivorans]